MKKMIMLVIVAIMMALTANAQTGTTKTLKLEKGVITVKDTTKKKTDQVVKVVDGISIYKGAKGGLYYWKISKKTGKLYKAYLSEKK